MTLKGYPKGSQNGKNPQNIYDREIQITETGGEAIIL